MDPFTLTALQVALTTADWSQTRQIAANPAYYEMNPILGRHPEAGRVNRYFILYEGAVLAISHEYPNVMGYSAVIEAGMVAHNYHIGLRVRF